VYIWGNTTMNYDLENEELQRMSSGGRANARKAKKLFASLADLPADAVEKTRLKAEKAKAKAEKERAAFGIQHTGWVQEEHSGMKWEHWKLE
jgi:hypothetical protein